MITKNPSNFFSGLSGLELPVPKYQFPEEYQNASRLTYYSTFFNSIEINSSFYKIPMKATVTRWAGSVHDNLKFTFKLYKEITRVKNLDFDTIHIQQFMEAISNVGPKKGCVLIQFPPGLKNENMGQLDIILKSIKMSDPDNSWNIAVEFRNKEWYNENVYEMLKSYQAALVIHDIPASATSLTTITGNIIYIRFHGPTGNYRGSYTDAFLFEYSEHIREWLAEGKSVYVYFNNTVGDAFNNLITLNRFLGYQ